MSAGRIPTTANSPLTAKGDLFSFSTAPARLAVGSNGDTIVADSSTSTGLRYTENYAAGKNKIINGDFNVNQRNFSTSTVGNANLLCFDRFMQFSLSGTTTWSAQTFTLGSAPVSGYEGKNFLQITSTGQSGTGANSRIVQKIESARTFAGETVIVSFFARATSGTPSLASFAYQDFGTGGSPSAGLVVNGNKVTLSTSWAHYSILITIPSISGKTIGTNNDDSLWIQFITSGGSDFNTQSNSIGIQSTTIQLWGVQVEAGSVATAFQTATGTIQGELAACQRYYYNSMGQNQIVGINTNTTTTILTARPPVTMRTTPTATLPTSGSIDSYQDGAKTSATAATSVYLSDSLAVFASVGYSGLTVGSTATWRSTTAFQLSAEL